MTGWPLALRGWYTKRGFAGSGALVSFELFTRASFDVDGESEAVISLGFLVGK